MIKIKLQDYHLHRNECLFRPYKQNKLFNEVGIEFVTEGNDYDILWIGQASYMDKTKSYKESVDMGIEYVNQFKGQDVIMLDGQDSATLKGSYDVFVQTDSKLLLKNTLYKDLKNYARGSFPTGRIYWNGSYPNHKNNYWLSVYDLETEKFQNVKLSGTNWLSTVNPTFHDYYQFKKDIDVFAMFQYPAKQNFEWKVETSNYYTAHREKCIAEIKKLSPNIKVVTAENGKVPLQEYYNLMARSKIVIAPFGYGEIAPRDLESAMLGCVLIKPDMGHVETVPNIYNPETFIPCQWNFGDLTALIGACLNDYELKREYYVNNMKRTYRTEYTDEKLVLHIYNLLQGLEGYGTHKI